MNEDMIPVGAVSRNRLATSHVGMKGALRVLDSRQAVANRLLACLSLSAKTFAALMLGHRSPGDAIDEGSVVVEGDQPAVTQFFTLLDYDMTPRSLLH